ncbi:hypothetical protein PV326_013084, partial [Microctonus aethiopoides]
CLVSFVILLCGLYCWKISYKLWIKYSKLIKAGKSFPGPRAIPLLGNVFEFLLSGSDALTVFGELGRKYPTNRLWLGPKLFINISLPKDIEVVIKSGKTANKAFVYKFMEPAVKNSLVNGDAGPLLRAHRKLLIPIINGEYLESYMQVINEQVRRSVNILAKKADLEEIDIHDETEYCVADIGYETLHGIPGVGQDQGDLFIPHTVASSLDIFIHRAISPWLYPTFLFNFSKSGKIWNANTKIGQNFVQKIIIEKKKLYEALARGDPDVKKPKPSILDLLMEHVVETNAMNEEEIMSEATTLFIGFYDTVLGIYSFSILMLAMHPEQQNKVREEVMAVFETDRDVMEEDLRKLKHTEMVIKEVIRLFPIGPLMPREVTDDLKLDEYTLPKGATVCMMPFLTHRLEEYWDKPNSFIPERFLPENSRDRHPFAYIPFSSGPRSCPGSKFGMACLKIMIVHFIRNYQFSTTMELDKIKLKTHLSIQSIDGYKVSMKKIYP